MEFQELVSGGWPNHEKDTEGVAVSLEEHAGLVTDGARANQFAALVNHSIGEHLGDWTRAAHLIERVTGGLPADSGLASSLGNLAVARFFAGDEVGAVAADMRSATLAGEAALPTLARNRFLLASGLLALKRYEDCGTVYGAALDLAALLPEGTTADRAAAVVSNNLASALLEVAERSAAQDALMVRAAEASRTYWLRGGTWMNDERADYLLARVMGGLLRHGEALEFAERGLATIAANGEEPVDQAFLRLAAAAAHRGLGDSERHAEEVSKAEALAAGFQEQWLRDWFESEAAKVR